LHADIGRRTGAKLALGGTRPSLGLVLGTEQLRNLYGQLIPLVLITHARIRELLACEEAISERFLDSHPQLVVLFLEAICMATACPTSNLVKCPRLDFSQLCL
jgi:hypothetical protein